ncbi:MAG TPA: 16S rRNA (adenine(1518)-N(6)/adenine(1519)-N(6))-dimethyltransferase RsmA [Vicinamibacterales bacterium]|nr:16S rRNA (adenine(1518)-N(6)/adenine(1519)-N(6))-dimethyltransferase RsmA [Vicinamibacterales bacterium]
MVRSRKRFGQHFLEPVWADKLVDAIAPRPEDVFFEIGPGPGILTMRLAPRVSRVIAIEIDRDMVAGLSPKLQANASIVTADILEADLLAALSPIDATNPIRVAGNLPYNISSPILFRLLELQRHRLLTDATLMLQREVADRIIAKPGTTEYGVLSVLVQWRADATRLMALPPGAFRPPPAVRSAVIRLAFRPSPFAVADEPIFERMVRRMFTQRRKTLSNALAAFGTDIGLPATEALRTADLDPRRRPETLEIVEIARLADVFATAKR